MTCEKRSYSITYWVGEISVTVTGASSIAGCEDAVVKLVKGFAPRKHAFEIGDLLQTKRGFVGRVVTLLSANSDGKIGYRLYNDGACVFRIAFAESVVRYEEPTLDTVLGEVQNRLVRAGDWLFAAVGLVRIAEKLADGSLLVIAKDSHCFHAVFPKDLSWEEPSGHAALSDGFPPDDLMLRIRRSEFEMKYAEVLGHGVISVEMMQDLMVLVEGGWRYVSTGHVAISAGKAHHEYALKILRRVCPKSLIATVNGVRV